MTPEEARSLGRAIQAARVEQGLTQIKLAVALCVSAGHVGIWEHGHVPAARGRPAKTYQLSRDQIE